MYNYILDNGLKANIWINEVIKENNGYKNTMFSKKDELINTGKKKIVIELFIPRAHNNYALLGLEYTANVEKNMMYKISIDDINSQEYNNSIALSHDKVTWGILDEYKLGIINSVSNYLNNNSLPNGMIDFNISAHAEIGSSQLMFEKVSDILLLLLAKESIDENIALFIIKNYFNIK